MSAVPWHLKTRALLLPTALAAVDPQGEPERQEALRARLASLGITATPADDELLSDCARDAHDAQVVLDLSDDAVAPAGDVGPLQHPLSAETEEGARLDTSAAAGEALRLLDAWRPSEAEHSYRALWRALCDPQSAASRLPGDRRLPDHSVAAHRSLSAALAGARHDGRQAALLYVHLGPVQSFIATARRTHDLWVGSFTLTYLVSRGATLLAQRLGPDAVVSPSLARLPLLDRLLFERPTERIETLRSSVPNRLLAVVPAEKGGEIAAAVAGAISGTWREMAREACRKLERETTSFDEQIDDHLEIEAVLLPWPRTRAEVHDVLRRAGLREAPLGWWLDGSAPGQEPRTGVSYGLLFDLTHRVLAAQRRTPKLGAVPAGDHRPKCSLCGEREQMGPREPPDRSHRQLRTSREFWQKFALEKMRSSLQIVAGEGLCAVCLTKRLAPETYFGRPQASLEVDWNDPNDRTLLRFPSLESIASAPFRRVLLSTDTLARERREWARALDSLLDRDCLDFDAPGNLLPGLGRIGRADPFLKHDGEWLYKTSYQPRAAEHNYFPDGRCDDALRTTIRERLAPAAQALRALRRGSDADASPYYAVVQLDGDRMGEWLTGRHEHMPTVGESVRDVRLDAALAARRRPLFPALHAELSRRLGDLARELYIVVEDHLGRVVYTGGDDLLALLPLATALPCLGRIRALVRAARFLGRHVTISAGVAIAHVHDPLSRTLELARKAERHAKDAGRNRFTVVVDKRSGAELRLTLPFEIGGGVDDVIGCILGLLDPAPHASARGRDEERWPLRAVTVAHRLEDELRALGLDDDEPPDPTLLKAFRHRVSVLLGFTPSLEQAAPRHPAAALLHALLGEHQIQVRPRDAVNLLLLAHFLLREEHGIRTGDLLRRLGVGGRP